MVAQTHTPTYLEHLQVWDQPKQHSETRMSERQQKYQDITVRL